MQVLRYIIKKEFLQIFRDKAILPMMTVLPMVQMILLSFAANNEVKQVNIYIADQNKSQFSQRLIQKIEAVEEFRLIGYSNSTEEGNKALLKGTADIVLTIPPKSERDFFRKRSTKVQLLVNAINGQAATVGTGYLTQVIREFNNEILSEVALTMSLKVEMSKINIEYSNWYNPELDYKTFMVPGILGELVIILVMLLSAMNIVREREVGTIEQVNVTPISKWHFILGKMIPFLIIGLGLLAMGLALGKLIFDIPMRGNLAIVFAYCVLNITAVLGMGLLISNFANTQQQAIFISFFFVIIFVLLGGLFTPIESMPKWAQYLTIPNPIAHFVAVMRQVLLKGSGFFDVFYHFRITAILALVFNGLAILTYKKTV
jgi:ABC-2 type transport system permease protein